MQVTDREIATTPQDVPIERVVTPQRSIRAATADEKPTGIAWDALDEDRLDEIPILDRLKRD